MNKFTFVAAFAASWVGLATAADATVTLFTDRAAFLAAVLNPGTDTFDDLPAGLLPATLDRTAGSYGYTVSAPNGLFSGSLGAGDVFMIANRSTNSLLFSGFTGGVGAIGADIFAADFPGVFAAVSSISVVFEAGGNENVFVITNPTATSFFGIRSTSGLTSFAIVGPGTIDGPFRWPSANNLVLAAAIPEPATWAMLIAGFGLVGVAARRRRPAAA